jgi:vacuolar-type H+-ATPase subunit E/Vma4
LGCGFNGELPAVRDVITERIDFMDTTDVDERKLYNFERLILTDAEEKREKILSQAREEQARQLEQTRNDLSHKYERRLSREQLRIDKSINEQSSALQTSQKKELLSVRERLIASVFENVAARLSEYSATDA